MTRRARGWLIALGVFVVLVGLMAVASFAGMGAVRRAVVNEVDLTKVADGSYKGAFGAGRFQFAVTVSVKDHRIEAVDLVDASKATDMTRAISAAIVEKQKVALDAVSGASLTTRAFTKAVQNALAP